MEVLDVGSQGESTSLPKSVPVASMFSVLTLQGDKDDKEGMGKYWRLEKMSSFSVYWLRTLLCAALW